MAVVKTSDSFGGVVSSGSSSSTPNLPVPVDIEVKASSKSSMLRKVAKSVKPLKYALLLGDLLSALLSSDGGSGGGSGGGSDVTSGKGGSFDGVVFTGGSGVVFPPMPDPYYQYGDNLLDVLKNNGKDISSHLSSLTSIVSFNLDVVSKSVGASSFALYSIDQKLDVSNAIFSEIYGVLFSIAEILNNMLAVQAQDYNDKVQYRKLLLSRLIGIENVLGELLQFFDTKLEVFGDRYSSEKHSFLVKFDEIVNSLDSVVREFISLREANSEVVGNLNQTIFDAFTLFMNNFVNVFEKNKLKDESIIDHFTYLKNQTEVKDLDGNTIANISPRELEAIKNASVAREKTDINNFELEDADFEISDLSNITLLDLVKFSKILQDVNNGS